MAHDANITAQMSCNKELRQTALGKLKGRWCNPVIASIIFSVITSITGWFSETDSWALALVVIAVYLFVAIPLSVGYELAILDVARGNFNVVSNMFSTFNHYTRWLALLLLRAVYVMLWSLLLFVPGWIKSYSYAMAAYIAKDNPHFSAEECIDRSMQMMKGYKMKLFLLDLSFIGWYLLGILTLGIGLFWVMPYHYTSRSCFYEELNSIQ